MKKLFLAFVIAIIGINSTAQNNTQMIFDNDFRAVTNEYGNLTQMFMSEGWWTDMNGDDAAVIRIKVQNMSLSDIKNLSFKGSANLGLGKKQFFEQEQQWFVAVTAGSNMYLEVTHPTYGTSSRLSISEKLLPKTIYEVTLINNRTTSISVRSIPEGATVYLDGDMKGVSNIEIPAQRFGKHKLMLLYQGKTIEREIVVEEGHTVFEDFDFRKRKAINITSDPNGAQIYVDNIDIGVAPIYNYEVVEGPHHFRAYIDETRQDEKSVNITYGTNQIDLHPVKKSNVLITTKYAGRPVSARLTVDNNANYQGEDSYLLTLPYGRHSFETSYGGKSKRKVINVNRPEMSHVFKLSAKRDFVWFWDREFEQYPFKWEMGYVSKKLVARSGTEKAVIDAAYGRENNCVEGMRMGLSYSPMADWGGGIYTGFFYELYLDYSNSYGEGAQWFQEHALSVPLHLYYGLKFSENFCIGLHGGISMDLGLYAAYTHDLLGMDTNKNGNNWEVYDEHYYGKDNYGPGRFNLMWDLAADIIIHRFTISIFQSKGLINHEGIFSGDDVTTHLNKWGLTIGIGL